MKYYLYGVSDIYVYTENLVKIQAPLRDQMIGRILRSQCCFFILGT